MIELGPFTKEQYEALVPGSIADYAAEHVKSGRWSADEAAANCSDRAAVGLIEIFKPYRRKGYAEEATRALVKRL